MRCCAATCHCATAAVVRQPIPCSSLRRAASCAMHQPPPCTSTSSNGDGGSDKAAAAAVCSGGGGGEGRPRAAAVAASQVGSQHGQGGSQHKRPPRTCKLAALTARSMPWAGGSISIDSHNTDIYRAALLATWTVFLGKRVCLPVCCQFCWLLYLQLSVCMNRCVKSLKFERKIVRVRDPSVVSVLYHWTLNIQSTILRSNIIKRAPSSPRTP